MWVKIMHLALCDRCKWSYHLWDETGRTKILQKYWEAKSLIRKLLMASTVDPNLRYLARQNYVFSWTRESGYFGLPYNTIPTSIEKVNSRMRWLNSLCHFKFEWFFGSSELWIFWHARFQYGLWDLLNHSGESSFSRKRSRQCGPTLQFNDY